MFPLKPPSYQRNQRSHTLASPQELQALQRKPNTEPQSSLVEDLSALQLAPDPFQDVPVLSKTPAELYLFDTETDVFVAQEKEVQVDIAANTEFERT